jgi:hypothetical protein
VVDVVETGVVADLEEEALAAAAVVALAVSVEEAAAVAEPVGVGSLHYL